MPGYHERELTDDDASTDAATMAAVAAGSDDALRRLYDRYGRMVYAVAYRVTTDASLAEECTQDVFVRAWRRARDYDPARGGVSTWLYAIARNRAIELWRASSRRAALTQEVATAVRIEEHDPDDPAALAAAADEAIRVAEAVAALPDEQLQTIQLAYFEGLSHAEIAARLDIPLGTVKGRIRLALERLRGLAGELHLEQVAP